MKLLDILKQNAIIPDLTSRHKQEVLDELCQVLADGEKLEKEPLVEVLLEREKLGSTGIGDGIAIPHGKHKKLDSLVMACGRSREGVDFESMDGKPTHLFFLLIAPESSAGTHLKALAKISRLLKDSSFRQEFLSAADSAEIYKLIEIEGQRFLTKWCPMSPIQCKNELHDGMRVNLSAVGRYMDSPVRSVKKDGP